MLHQRYLFEGRSQKSFTSPILNPVHLRNYMSDSLLFRELHNTSKRGLWRTFEDGNRGSVCTQRPRPDCPCQKPCPSLQVLTACKLMPSFMKARAERIQPSTSIDLLRLKRMYSVPGYVSRYINEGHFVQGSRGYRSGA